jgi:hypothetical protein
MGKSEPVTLEDTKMTKQTKKLLQIHYFINLADNLKNNIHYPYFTMILLFAFHPFISMHSVTKSTKFNNLLACYRIYMYECDIMSKKHPLTL